MVLIISFELFVSVLSWNLECLTRMHAFWQYICLCQKCTEIKRLYNLCFLSTMYCTNALSISFHKARLSWCSYKYEDFRSQKICIFAYLLPHEKFEWRSTICASAFLADFRLQNQIFPCHIVQCQGAGSLEHNTEYFMRCFCRLINSRGINYTTYIPNL